MKNIVPHGEMVLIQFKEIPKKKELYVPGPGGILSKSEDKDAPKHEAIVVAVGEGVDLSKTGWKIGDKVIFNNYDMKTFGDDDNNTFGLCKIESIWATYEG